MINTMHSHSHYNLIVGFVSCAQVAAASGSPCTLLRAAGGARVASCVCVLCWNDTNKPFTWEDEGIRGKNIKGSEFEK